MKAMSSLGRRAFPVIASIAVSLAGCTDDRGTPAPPVAGAVPTALAGLPSGRAAVAETTATPVQAVRAGSTLDLAPASVELQSGHAYWVRLPDEWLPVASDQSDPQRSTVVVEEDGVALAPGNVPLATVQTVGRGSYLHWGGWLYFSSSDNTDPRSNGRQYRIVLAPG